MFVEARAIASLQVMGSGMPEWVKVLSAKLSV